MMIGMSVMPRSMRRASAPSRSGRPRSSTTRSGASAATRRSASSAVPTACTVCPRSVSDRNSAPRTTWSSSTRSTVAMGSPYCAGQDVGMRRRLSYLAVWALATATTIGVSYWAIRPVLVAASSEVRAAVRGRRTAGRRAVAVPAPSLSPSPSPSPSPPRSPRHRRRSCRRPRVGCATPDATGGTAGTHVRAAGRAGDSVLQPGATYGDRHHPANGFTSPRRRLSPDSAVVYLLRGQVHLAVVGHLANSCYSEITESVDLI